MTTLKMSKRISVSSILLFLFFLFPFSKNKKGVIKDCVKVNELIKSWIEFIYFSFTISAQVFSGLSKTAVKIENADSMFLQGIASLSRTLSEWSSILNNRITHHEYHLSLRVSVDFSCLKHFAFLLQLFLLWMFAFIYRPPNIQETLLFIFFFIPTITMQLFCLVSHFISLTDLRHSHSVVQLPLPYL